MVRAAAAAWAVVAVYWLAWAPITQGRLPVVGELVWPVAALLIAALIGWQRSAFAAMTAGYLAAFFALVAIPDVLLGANTLVALVGFVVLAVLAVLSFRARAEINAPPPQW
jgi:hypothetical protein